MSKPSNYETMTLTPVSHLIFTLCIPTVASMLITNFYNLVDTYFVDQLGISAGGAVGVVFSLMAIIQAVGFMLGHGSGTTVSYFLGRKDTDAASRCASTGFFCALACGFFLCVVGIWQLPNFMRLLGSTETILPYAQEYGLWILLAAPFMTASCVLNVVLRYEGKATLAMYGLSAGALLNMLGDPLLIIGMDLGIRGAGISTAVSQFISFCILLAPFLTRRTQCRISPRLFSEKKEMMARILRNGMPSLMRQGLTSFSAMTFNHCAAPYGDAAITAISIVTRISSFLLSFIIGIGQGMQPVTGFNHSAGNGKRVLDAFFFTACLGECVVAVLSVICFFGADQILIQFSAEESVLSIARTMLRYQSVTLLLGPIIVYTNQLFQSVSESRIATWLSALRSGLCLIPILFVFSRLWGIPGVQVAQPTADILAFLISLPILRRYLRTLHAEMA